MGKVKHNEITFLLLFVHGKSKNVTLAKLKMVSHCKNVIKPEE